MASDLTTFNIEGQAFNGKKRLMNVVTVQYDTSFQKVECDARELFLSPGDRVVVDTERGPILGKVCSWGTRAVRKPREVDRVLRRATATDLEAERANAAAERGAYKFALKRIAARRLKMKLVRVQYMIDASKIVFYFSADGRVDFRDLVKDLAHHFRTRIEMFQIGARDGTRMIGGIGSCGRELCCSTFLTEFAPVSIRMAKDQGLTLNPTKVSGMCGRLMCCLVYEQQLYRSMKKRMPRSGAAVRTALGPGKVQSIDVLNRRVVVELDGDDSRHTLSVDDIVVGGAESDGYVDTAPTLRPQYQWDDEPDAGELKSLPTRPKRSRRRRRSKGPKGESDG